MTAWRLVAYKQLNARQKENYNFQKLAAALADYGFNCLRLTDDWEGADFIACHVDGQTFLKVQLKGRLAFDRKYCGKNIHIAFRDGDHFYLYPHDVLLNDVMALGLVKGSDSWEQKGTYHFSSLSQKQLNLLRPYRIAPYRR
ncbi:MULTISPECIES: hypothetical protein [Chromobacterium]|uniref:DUF4365 domain-containing protein n=2 Tax=Chromobacterium TaxID=535 RepID=A0A202BBZ3_CHRVL|nr:hypothetical protein [Chromobacterium violaceum]MBX9345636.1 hypothetical protein [Chromobacterium vaccinii]OQS11782.1 hypothetical protein B0T38_03615 [Chromobacterium violaceum]OQS29082.1 hypothetical protein B0T37_03675 [Chromobacterium violaceum]OQS29637.1 hypothetical protein B0T41_03670 [Chromobacterium violaceum]OVE49067.1 hypothetical protein CBW21_07615 [Chromobacterium violaceum]